MPTKKLSKQHLIEKDSISILTTILPKHWILHEYRPDYGIDYVLEIFRNLNNDLYETLGEHVFIQVKGKENIEVKQQKVFDRMNIEKYNETDKKKYEIIPVIKFSIETSELMTVQRMSSSLPVLLILVDTKSKNAYFLCLNDYIEKILIHEDPYYYKKNKKTITIPIANQLNSDVGQVAIRWYGKRAKLYAAFQKFYFQYIELQNINNQQQLISIVKRFIFIIRQYDLWNDMEMWKIINTYYQDILNIENNLGKPETINSIFNCWHGLSLLSRNYEDVCKEWFLPTSLGIVTSYQKNA